MQIARTEEQRELGLAVRGLLAKRSDSAAVRATMLTASGYDAELWSALCEQVGVAALAIPEEHDGFGATLVETGVVLEELGERLTPTPLLGSAMAAAALRLAGHHEPLGELAAGGLGALALPGETLVLDARPDALLLELTGDGSLRRVQGAATPEESMDQTLRFGRLSAETVHGETVGGPVDVEAVAAIRVALTSALQVGAMQRSLDMTVQYSGERVQFGRLIGSFQALKHRMADMLVSVEASRSASWGAIAAAAAYLEDPTPQNGATAVRLARVAGSYCTDAGAHVASELIQLHGGIAITWEHDAHLLFKRLHALGTLNGSAHQQRAGLLAG